MIVKTTQVVLVVRHTYSSPIGRFTLARERGSFLAKRMHELAFSVPTSLPVSKKTYLFYYKQFRYNR